MNNTLFSAAVAASLVMAGSAVSTVSAAGGPPGAGTPAAAAEDPAYVLGFTLPDIDGADQDLAQYKGKVVLLVNTASKCGLTPQYAKLEKLYESKKDAGLVILGFPANNFNGQEPGTNQQIKEFCTGEYHVSFPMFAKISVKGDDQHALYKKLSGQPKPIGGDPEWNFAKFLVDRNGRVVARFPSKMAPDDPAIAAKIDELLAAK